MGSNERTEAKDSKRQCRMHSGVRRKKTWNGSLSQGVYIPGAAWEQGGAAPAADVLRAMSPVRAWHPSRGRSPRARLERRGVGAARAETLHLRDAIGFVAVACPCTPSALRLLDAAQHLLTPLRFCPIVISLAVWGAVGSPAQALTV